MSQFEGFEELERKFKALTGKDQAKTLRAANNAGGQALVKAARLNAPTGKEPHKTYKGRWVAPGFTKRSVMKKTSLSRSRDAATTRVGVAAEAFYALQFIELGTRHIPAQPWLTRTYRAQQNNVTAAWAKKYRDSITKIAAQ